MRASRLMPLYFALLCGLIVFVVGPAAAGPVGAIAEFSSGLNPGANPAQVQAGSDGNLWFSDRAGAVGRITTGGTISEFSAGLNRRVRPVDGDGRRRQHVVQR